MASDLLSTIATEIDARLAELRPLLAEYEQLFVAAAALDSERASPPARPRTAGGAPRATATTRRTRAATGTTKPKRAPRVTAKPPRATPRRSVRGAAREAILAALDHGSHTVAELTVVTAMKAPNVNANLRRLLLEGSVAKTTREGKTAYALPKTG
jgi:hypothetical protein